MWKEEIEKALKNLVISRGKVEDVEHRRKDKISKPKIPGNLHKLFDSFY
ncbi:MAG: hypothetical protein ACRC28_05645 [Clostridium sp.]